MYRCQLLVTPGIPAIAGGRRAITGKHKREREERLGRPSVVTRGGLAGRGRGMASAGGSTGVNRTRGQYSDPKGQHTGFIVARLQLPLATILLLSSLEIS